MTQEGTKHQQNTLCTCVFCSSLVAKSWIVFVPHSLRLDKTHCKDHTTTGTRLRKRINSFVLLIKEYKSIQAAATAHPFKSKSQIKFRSRLCLMNPPFFSCHRFKHKLKTAPYLCSMWNEDASQGESPKPEAAVGLLSKGLKISFKVQCYITFFRDEQVWIQA